MAATPEFPILSTDEALAKFKEYGAGKRDLYLAFYSSVYGGIVTDSALMRCFKQYAFVIQTQ